MSGKNAIQNYAVAGIVDVLGRFGVPTATALQIYNDVLDKRSQTAMEILLKEIRQGNFECIDQNDAVSIIARYQRDAMEGVAKNNLRLMARIINGMAEKKKLEAPSFLRYAHILASLTEEEITVLGIMAKLNWATFMPCEVTKQFKEAGFDNYQTIQQALLRTGLVTLRLDAKTIPEKPEIRKIYGSSDKVDTNQVFTLTPLFSEIEKYIKNFDMKEDEAVA